jgi:hypothetical protein
MYTNLYGVIDVRTGILVDVWVAHTFEEAQKDNPDKKILDFKHFEKHNFILKELFYIMKCQIVVYHWLNSIDPKILKI